MPKERNAFRVGLAVLLMFSLFVAVLVFLADRVSGPTLRVIVRFPDGTQLPPLSTGSIVQFAGTAVGNVAGVELHEVPLSQSPTDGTSDAEAGALVYFDVAIDVTRDVELREDCRITAASPIIGTVGTVLIKERGTSPGRLADGAVVRGVAPVSIDQLTEQLVDVANLLAHELDGKNPGTLMARIKDELNAVNERSLLGKIHRSVDDLNHITARTAMELDATQRAALIARLHGILDHVNSLTSALSQQADGDRQGALMARLHTTLEAVQTGLGAATEMIQESRTPVRNTLASVESTARRLDQNIAKPIAEQLDVDNPISLLAKIHLSVDRIHTSLADVNAMTTAGRETVSLNVDRLDAAMRNIKEGSDHLRAGLRDLRLNPWRLLYQPTPNETREENIHRAARDFAEAATRLDDAVSRMRALAEARDGSIRGDDEQLVEIRATLSETFRRFTAAEEALWRELQIE